MSVPQRVCLVCSPRPHWAEQADQGDQRCRPGSWQRCVLHGYVSSDTPENVIQGFLMFQISQCIEKKYILGDKINCFVSCFLRVWMSY